MRSIPTDTQFQDITPTSIAELQEKLEKLEIEELGDGEGREGIDVDADDDLII